MVIGIVLSTIGVALTIAIWASRRRTARGTKSLIVFSFALMVWAIAFGLYVSNILSNGLIWLNLIYLSATVASTSLLTFTLAFTNHKEWLTRWNIFILAIEPVVAQVSFWAGRGHEAFFSSRPDSFGIISTAGPWYWINATYSYGLLVLALILLTQNLVRKSKLYLLQSITIAIGIFIPILIKILSLSGLVSISNLELAPISFTITGLLLIYGIYRFKWLDLAPIARDVVVECMSDGWMVIDPNNRIVDLNPAAEALIGLSREKVFGQPAEQILWNCPKLNQDSPIRELETKGSVKLHGEWRYLNVRILPLVNSSERQIGKIVLWRDITERKKSDDARQSARDEMFVLLHSISGAANQTLNLDDFLAESIYQIVYSFQSQASLIYMLDDSDTEDTGPQYYVAAHHGLAEDSLSYLSSSSKVLEMVTWTLKHKEPFFVSDASTDPRLPPPMQQLGLQSLLIAPLITGEEALGAISLIRKEGSPYDQDEITRLGVLAEELASLIHTDRQRQLAIILEERQRLVRDLHDSVTQKLYGLVALTEAAQANLETGTVVQPTQVLARIGENARQALKEMRLFLFEMKPIDLKHEGLVAALHQRLAAVEGRADIKARLLADDKITLPMDKQIALYYIAQEALNNTLKHASAQSVMIRLKNRKTSIVLEVEDDGRGFDPKTADKGGMGLRNMQERVSAVGGKLKLESVPGEGTKIIVTVSKDRTRSATKKGKGK
jgi:PAS domain S-box-containing protein